MKHQCKVCRTDCNVITDWGTPIIDCPRCGKYYIDKAELFTIIGEFEVIDDGTDALISHEMVLLSEETALSEELPLIVEKPVRKRGTKAVRS